jgi:hypothetical protein
MSYFSEIAKQYSKAGFSVIPINQDKNPALRSWQEFQNRPMTEVECQENFKSCHGFALLGGTQKNITFLDFDLKYSLTSDFFDRYKALIPNELLAKMYVQKTRNSGFHFAFMCDKIENNQKLASRYTTPFERHETYLEAFNNPKTRDKALKIASLDTVRVLIETRGNGGYCLMSPTKGYEHVYGKIQKISIDEYDLLLSAARSLSEVIEIRKDIKVDKYKEWKLSPFTDFNERFDTLSFLEENGWEIVGNSGKSTRLKRAGNPSSKSSALFDNDSRLLNCFSTSTLLETNRGYTPTDLFALFECDNDLSVAFKKIIDMGYGEQ